MVEKEIYLDNNATTQPLPLVRDEMMRALGKDFGNASSAHSTGERARKHLAEARDNVAELIGGDPSNLIFTGSGTEANNLVLMSCLTKKNKPSQIVTSSVEHSSILKTCDHFLGKGTDVLFLNVDPSGLINLQQLEDAISGATSLVSIQWVNNETGVIQPIEEISQICRSKGVLFHTDAAQAIGKIEVNVESLPIDFLTLTGHKFHAPSGVGAIYAKNLNALSPLMFGGPQELGLRPGTENLSGIVGIGKAAELRKANFLNVKRKTTEMRDSFEEKILQNIPNSKINGHPKDRTGNSTNILFNGINGQALVVRLDQMGIRCSQSAACTNMKPEPSHVLRAMGLSEEEAYSSVRFSFSEQNTFEEIEKAVNTILEVCEKLHPISVLLSNNN